MHIMESQRPNNFCRYIYENGGLKLIKFRENLNLSQRLQSNLNPQMYSSLMNRRPAVGHVTKTYLLSLWNTKVAVRICCSLF